MAAKGFKYREITGGGPEALDSRNGSLIAVGNIAIVTDGVWRNDYEAIASNAPENAPYLIAPDLNPGNIRWQLLKYPLESLPESFEDSILPNYGVPEAGKAIIVSPTGALEWGEAGGGLKWSTSAVNVTTTKGNGFLMDTSAGDKIVTLHAAPEEGNTIAVGDRFGTFNIHGCTISRNGMKIQGLAEDLILDVKNQRVTLVYTASDNNWNITELEPSGSQYEYMPYAVMHVQDQKPSGTGGGSSATGIQVRTLNTITKNEISGASLSGNQITLPPGEYDLEACAGNRSSGLAKLMIYNVTLSSYLAHGSCLNISASADNSINLDLSTHLTLATQTVIELRHYVSGGVANGFGNAASQGTEVYADLKITKIGNNYAPKPVISSARSETIPNLPTTGGIEGFDITKTGPNQLTITKGTCTDSTKLIPLALVADTTLAIPSTLANTIYHIFVVRFIDGNYGVKAYESEAAAAADGTIDAFRWIGFWKTNGAKFCVEGLLSGDCFAFGKPSESAFVSGFSSTTYVLLNLTSAVPVDRVSEVLIGLISLSVETGLGFSIDGVNSIASIGGWVGSTTDTGTPWNFSQYGMPFTRIPVKGGVVYGKIGAGAATLGVAQVKLRR